MPCKRLIQLVRRLPSSPQRFPVVIEQQIAVERMRAVADNLLRPLARCEPTQVGQTLLRHDNVDVVFVVIAVRHHRHDARDAAALRHRLRREDRARSIAREITRTANAVHHVRAAHVRGVHVAVDVAFERSVERDKPKPANHLGMVADFLRTQHEPVAIAIEFAEHLLLTRGRQRDGRAGRERDLAFVEQIEGGVLKHF